MDIHWSNVWVSSVPHVRHFYPKKKSLTFTPEPVSVSRAVLAARPSTFDHASPAELFLCRGLVLSFHSSLSLVNVYPLGFEWVAYGKMSLFLFWGWAQSQDHLVISPHDHHTQHPSTTNMIRSWVKLVWQRSYMHLFCKNVSQIVISYFRPQHWFFFFKYMPIFANYVVQVLSGFTTQSKHNQREHCKWPLKSKVRP